MSCDREMQVWWILLLMDALHGFGFLLTALSSLAYYLCHIWKMAVAGVRRHRQTHHHAAERAFAERFFLVTKKPFLETFPFSDFSYISLVRNGSHDLFQTSQS